MKKEQGDNTWYKKGSDLFLSGRYGKALRCYDHALKFDPNDVLVWNDKGI